jgi:long-chain acyl-CoA synthetase
MSKVLLTGASGFVGTWVAKWFLDNSGHGIVAPIRAGDEEQAIARLRRAWWDWPALREQIGERVDVVVGDITKESLGLAPESLSVVRGEIECVVHCAASVWFDRSAEEMERVNVQGTRNVLELAKSIQSSRGLERFSHVSTAYVAGRRMGDIRESDLSDTSGFNNEYERSKFRSEMLVRESAGDIPTSIFRPGMIVGDSRNGWVRTFNTLYLPLRLYLTGKRRILPASRDLRINMVPVDYVADSIAKMTLDERAEGVTMHLTPSFDRMPTAGELVDKVREWGNNNLDMQLPKPLFMRLPPFGGGRMMETYRLLRPYLNERRRFLRDTAERLLGTYDIDWERLLEKMLEFGVYHGFLHRSERTVHEQIVFRMGSKTRALRYHDLEEDRSVRIDPEQLRSVMLRSASALRNLGIGKGDKVAMVGLNSTRYLAVDVAIGLTGAVGVPLYYTSPPSEIREIVRDCGARAIFVGAPHLLESLEEFAGNQMVIDFSQTETPEGVMNWNEFLTQGSENATLPMVCPDDPATLRYTSSTTGRPKGVEFTHANLRWMAEAVASLFPWSARNQTVSYLSFLPMNHVVEGILGTYSPYFAPAPLELSFLRDFHDLSRSLPRVRPSIFFSIPRFYEKVWERVENSPSYQRYVKSRGWGKDIRRRLIRRALKRRTGLDRCAQLIVGSAPSSVEMLERFRGLGIEIHNAYGLTEAPLVTLNRLGANRIGTVGQPLPQTELRISDEGEIEVKGPQIMSGYYGKEEHPIADGWLKTGDLGSIDSEGYLVIEGRKKEVMVTSYGKTIQPEKIEIMLRSILGVQEAMLVAEGRPFCTALIWVERDAGVETMAHIDKHIKKMNSRLSRPERIVRWAVLPFDLSIDAGELTANLKIRRAVIASRYREIIDSIYLKEGLEDIHVGEVGEEK